MAEQQSCPYRCGKEWYGTADRKAEQPLDAEATASANEEVWSNCKRLTDQNGGKRQLTMAEGDKYCRRVWMDAYLAALAKQGKSPPRKATEDPRKPVLPCQKGALAVRVADASDAPVEGATVKVEGLGEKKTEKNGYADFGETSPKVYTITATKSHYSPKAGAPHGAAQTNFDVQAGRTNVAKLVLVPGCTSYQLKKPFLIARADDTNIVPRVTLTVNGEDMKNETMKLGQDATFGAGSATPTGYSAGSDEDTLKKRMVLLLAEFASNDQTGMAGRLVLDFLKKNTKITEFTDKDFDKAAASHENIIDFCDRVLGAPGKSAPTGVKVRIHQALEKAGWDVNAVKTLTGLGVPAFNRGSKVRGTEDFGNGLGLMMNGIQYVYIYVEDYEYHSCENRYKITLKFIFFDVFGLDDDDFREYGSGVYTFTDAGRGIAAWWQLQHQFGYAPVLARATVTRTFTVPTKPQ